MKKSAWQQHVNSCNNSKLSKLKYANKHDLAYHQLLYWIKKLSVKPKAVNASSPSSFEAPFASVQVKPLPPASNRKVLGVLEFPNGSKLSILDTQLLRGLPTLCLGQR
jgi:hypothetical protein